MRGQRFTFWANVWFGPTCWEWMAAREKDGRAVSWRDGKKTTAARIVYEAEHGPTDLWVLHTCDNPSCVRLDHLYAGTRAENDADRVRRNRSSRGLVHGAHWRAKTHCPKGHPYDAENTTHRSTTHQKNHRRCKACDRAYYHRHKHEELGGV